MDLVSHGDNNDIFRQTALDYVKSTKNKIFAQACIENLSSCKCCWQHQDHRPEILMDYSLPKNTSYKLKDCTCSCRHFSRMICREFPPMLCDLEFSTEEDSYHIDKKLKVSPEPGPGEGYMDHEYETDHVMFKYLSDNSPNKPLFTNKEMKKCHPMANQ